jgi:hypothetical protein
MLPPHLTPLLAKTIADVRSAFATAGGVGIERKRALLVHGLPDLGQAYVGPAILHAFEKFPGKYAPNTYRFVCVGWVSWLTFDDFD